MKINKMEITKEYLLEEYVKKRRKVQDLIKELGCDYKTFDKKKQEFGIKRDRTEDISGKTFNGWTVIRQLPPNKKWGGSRWLCECSCGAQKPKTRSAAIKGGGCHKCAAIRARSKDIVTHSYWINILRKAKKREIEVSITREYLEEIFIQQNGKCAITNLPIQFPDTTREKDRYSGNASLDRIDSNKNYEIYNCQFVHKFINLMKQDLDQGEFIKWCKLITEYNEANHPEKYL